MATRTISVAGGNWNATGAWDEGIVAVAGDDVVARGGGDSGNLTVNIGSACATLILTNYAGTMTFDAALTVTSTVTLVAGMTVAGTTGTLICTGSATLTSAGKTFTAKLMLKTAGQTYTLADNWTVNGLVAFQNGITVNSNTLTCAGGASIDGELSGTALIKLTGGTWSGNNWINNNLTIEGNVTISGSVDYRTGTFTYTSGTVTTTGSTLILGSPGPTLNTNGITFNTVRMQSGNATTTINSLLSAATLDIRGDVLPTFAGTAGWTVGTLMNSVVLDSNRAITLTQTNTYTVTTAITLAGTGALKWTLASSSGTLRVPFVMSGSSPTLTLVSATRVDSSGGNPIHTTGVITDSLNWDNATAGGTMWLS